MFREQGCLLTTAFQYHFSNLRNVKKNVFQYDHENNRFFFFSGIEADLAARRFAHFSAFRPVAKIGDIFGSLAKSTSSKLDSGETCEVSTTVDRDEDSHHSQIGKITFTKRKRAGKFK
jgi:hypothetical protein